MLSTALQNNQLIVQVIDNFLKPLTKLDLKTCHHSGGVSQIYRFFGQ